MESKQLLTWVQVDPSDELEGWVHPDDYHIEFHDLREEIGDPKPHPTEYCVLLETDGYHVCVPLYCGLEPIKDIYKTVGEAKKRAELEWAAQEVKNFERRYKSEIERLKFEIKRTETEYQLKGTLEEVDEFEKDLELYIKVNEMLRR